MNTLRTFVSWLLGLFKRREPLRVWVEQWTSSCKQEELHYFKAGTDEYVCGFNPKYIPHHKMARIMKDLGFESVGSRKR